MLNLEELDKKYKVSNDGLWLELFNMQDGIYWSSDMSVSEAVAKVKSGEIKKTFNTDISSSLEDFIVARDLNNELKLVPSGIFVLLFGNLDHLVTKEPIQYPADFIRFDDITDREVDFINQVYGLVPDKNEDPERLIGLRQDLRNMLRTASAVTVHELLYN